MQGQKVSQDTHLIQKDMKMKKYKSNGTTKDPRHFTYLYGKCPTVEGLSGTWATNKKYAQDLKAIITKIRNTKSR